MPSQSEVVQKLVSTVELVHEQLVKRTNAIDKLKRTNSDMLTTSIKELQDQQLSHVKDIFQAELTMVQDILHMFNELHDMPGCPSSPAADGAENVQANVGVSVNAAHDLVGGADRADRVGRADRADRDSESDLFIDQL